MAGEDHFRITVRDTFRLGGERGTVVTGRVAAGRVRTGDSVEMVIDGVATRTLVLEIEVQRRSVQEASADQDVALRLKDVDGVFVHSGDVVRAIRRAGDELRDWLWYGLLGDDAATASLDRRLAAVRVGWDTGALTRGAADKLYFDAAVFDGIDETLSKLDDPWRESLFTTLREWALADPSEKPIRIFGGIYSYEMESDPEKAAQMRKEVEDRHAEEDAHFMNVILPDIRAWWEARRS